MRTEGIGSAEFSTRDNEFEFYPLELDRFDFLSEESHNTLQKCSEGEYDQRYTSMDIVKTEE